METKMSTKRESLEAVLSRFKEIDNNGKWTKIDDFMSYLEWIDDAQLAREADVLFEKHKLGDPRCPSSHPRNKCLVPRIMDSVDLILDCYQEDGRLDPDHKYILRYYVTLTATGDILS